MSEHTHANRLAHETSPYLLQHAHNPVDWYPWGEEAFERAKTEDKPIFLSVGYAACHWCHVMAHESFQNEQIARVMNELFINVKVDREERPDIDDVYMTAVQMMTHQGGWPMSVWLTPQGKPFFAGTYFPPDERFGRPGFARVCQAVAQFYRDEKTKAQATGDQVLRAYRQVESAIGRADSLDPALIDRAVDALAQSYDPRHGGFGGAPKFPPSMAIELLMRTYRRTGRKSLLEMVERTLSKMALGGICDQLGGGFHRYSVDAEWLVPHFEKMLYDNALLARCYLEACRLTGNVFYSQVARNVLDYVLREMRDPRGGFYSTQDADSEGAEGKYYLWTPAQVAEVVGNRDDAELFCRIFGVTEQGNFENRTSILHLSRPLEVSARISGMEPTTLAERIAEMTAQLLAARQKRIPPARDDKVLTAWNGLMITSLARAGAALAEPRYLDAAVAAAEFIFSNLYRRGRLLHTCRNGVAKTGGYLDDYACFAEALVSLFEATFQRRWLDQADELAQAMLDHFWDPQAGAFFYTAADAEPLIARTKNAYDNATPSGNSVAAGVLLRLSRWLDKPQYRQSAERTAAAFAQMAANAPAGFHRMLCVADALLADPMELAVVGPPAQRHRLLQLVRTRYEPDLLVLAGAADDPELCGLPLMAGKAAGKDRAAAYLCRDYACGPPVTSPEELAAMLDSSADAQ